MLIFSLHASNLRAADDGMGWYDQDIWKNENRAFLWYPDAKKPKQAGQNRPQNTPVRNELAEFEMLQRNLDESRKIAVMARTASPLPGKVKYSTAIISP